MKMPFLGKHARDQIRGRFGVKAGQESRWFAAIHAKATQVAEFIGDEGNPVFYYINGRVGYRVDAVKELVITVVQNDSPAVATGKQAFKSRIQAFIKSEIDRATSAAHAAESFFAELDEDIRAELPELQKQLKRTRSLPKRLALMGRIAALEMRIAELPAEIKGARSEARREINGALANY